MMRRQKKLGQSALLPACLFLLGGVFLTEGPAYGTFIAMFSSVCYAGMIFLWGFSIQQRILQKNIRRPLLTSCALMLLMLFLRAGKYHFFPQNELMRRLLWYGYYIATIFAPLMGFLVASQMTAVDAKRNKTLNGLLFFLATVLTIGILTNDLHQLAFRFQPGFAAWNESYAHSVLYYAVVVWVVSLTLYSIVKIVLYCRVVACRRLAWIPVGLFAAGFLATEGAFLRWFSFFQVPELLCLTFIITWEGCIQTGLLPSNRNYETFFLHSGLSSRIIDNAGQVYYQAQAEEASFPKRENHAPIAGGSIVWADDLTQIHRLNAQLLEAQERLDEQTELINAENEMKEKRAKVEEKQRLYEQIGRFALPTLEAIRQTLADLSPQDADFREKMTQICVRGAYVKRRSNLMLLLDKQPVLNCEELLFSLQESLEYLSLGGGSSTLTHQGTGVVRAQALLLAYDFFEALIEERLSPALSLMVHLQCGAQGMTLRLVTEQPYVPSFVWTQRVSQLAGSVTSEQRDDVCYITLYFPKEQKAE